MSLNAQSSHIDQVMLNNTSNQQVIKTPPNKANLAEEVHEKSNSNSAESTTRSVDDHGDLIRRTPFCKVPGLRRSVPTKRFSYPTSSQVAKQNTGKRRSDDATTVDVSRVVKEDKSTAEEGKVIIDHNATIDTSDPKGGEGEVPVCKRLKSDDVRTFCESERALSSLSSAVSHIQKDGVVFDMDALSQFPVECICSPPSLNSLDATWTAQQQVVSSDSTEDLWKRTDTITQDTSIVSGAEDTKLLSAVVHSDRKTLQNRNSQEESDVIENPVSCAYLQKDASALRSEWKTGFHTARVKKIEISDKALNCAHALLEELDLPAVSLISHERRTPADEGVDVDILREGVDLNKGTTEMALPGMAQENHDGISTTFQAKDGPAFERYSPKVDGNVEEVREQRAAHTFVPKTDKIPGLDKERLSVVPGFCGFSTASGKQVHISESAMKQARKTLSEIDAELDVGDSDQTVEITREKEPSYGISNKERASGNGLREAASEGPLYSDNMPQSDQLHVDACGTNTSIIKEEIEEMALQKSEQAVNELKCKQNESVNDSLLEDLLNDCKRKRRDSLATICEENEGNQEHHGGIIKNTEEISDTPHTRSSEYQKNITTEYCSSKALNPGTPRVLFKTTSDNSVSASEAALSKTKNTWNKIDEELALEGAYKPRYNNPESLNSLRAVPAEVVDNLPRCVSIEKDSWSQIGEEMIVESSHVLSDDVLNTLQGTVNKPDQEFVPEDQYKSGTHATSFCGFKTAIGGGAGEISEASIAAFSGFHTAGGKKVTLSEEALKRGRDIMKRIAADPSESLQENIDCYSANGKLHCVSKDADNSLDQRRDKPGTNTTSLSSFSGFQTAVGKSVTLYKEMLEKGEAIMQQIDKSLEQNKDTSISYSLGTSGFSGFQTARGQSVKLSKDSMEKGAVIMQQIDDRSLQEHSVEHSHNATSFSGFQTARGQSVKLSKESLEKGAAIMQQINRSLQENSSLRSNNATSFSSFQTASGQSVKLSKKSLNKGAAIMQQIDRSLQEHSVEHSHNATSFSGFQTASGQSLKLSKELIEKGAAIMQQIDRSLHEKWDNSVSATSFSGFQTASGHSVNLSKESMEKGAAIMQQIDRSLHEKWDNSVSATSFSGFQTASGQSLKLSKESMEKGAAIMQQIDRSLHEKWDNSVSATSFSGFQTASGHSVNLSKESMEKGAAIMQQIDRSLHEKWDNSVSATSFSGFQTASGHSVNLSKESMEKGAAIMQQIDRSLHEKWDNSVSATSFSGFQTASGHSVNLSKESMEKGAAIMQQIDRSLHEKWDNSVSATSFSGFQTASGHSVNLSKESMEKGAAIMQQIDRSLHEKWDNSVSATSFSGFQTASGQSLKLSKESMEKGAAIMQQIDRSLHEKWDNSVSATSFSGFQTASGQSLKLSKESMEKGAAIMQQIDRSLHEKWDNSVSATSFSGFQTASGQSLKLSKESMEKGAAIMQQIDRSLHEKWDNSVSATSFSGFQTASGQSLKLSKESMEKGAAIMQQIDRSLHEKWDNSVSATSFSGFQTASGQSLKLSKESMEKGAAIMQQIDRSLHEKWDNSVSATSFSGFQTASGQSLKLSKESMEKGAAIMQQIDRSLQENKDNSASLTGFPKSKPSSTSFTGFSGFQTAGGKTVEISESALAKAKQTMTDIDSELQASNMETAALSLDASGKAREEISINERGSGHCGGTFEGFFSARSQRVSVLEQALTKAKPFLQETDSAFTESKTKHAEASVRGSVEHDEAVSREVLESSEALLAYESVMDASDASGRLQDGIAAGWSSPNTSGDSFIAGREKGKYLMKTL